MHVPTLALGLAAVSMVAGSPVGELEIRGRCVNGRKTHNSNFPPWELYCNVKPDGGTEMTSFSNVPSYQSCIEKCNNAGAITMFWIHTGQPCTCYSDSPPHSHTLDGHWVAYKIQDS